MFTKNNDNQKTKFSSFKKWLLVVSFSLLPFCQSSAKEIDGEQYSISQGIATKDLNAQQRQIIIKENKQVEVPDQLNGKATAKSRAAILASQNKIVKSAKSSPNQLTLNRDYYADFAIYSATSLLLDDYDNDGFYQTFSVTFDADIYSYSDNQLGEVYALMYISKNGGPWTHYFTTDNFIIEADSDLDEYEVITTFLSGYTNDHYDVLIDLYQVGYSDIVATYSSNDSSALYALPLESTDYNEPYVEVIEVSGGGIYWLIVILLGSLLIRIKSRIDQTQ